MADAQRLWDKSLDERINQQGFAPGEFPAEPPAALGLQLRGSCSGLSGEGRVGHSPRFVREKVGFGLLEASPSTPSPRHPAH